MDQEVSAFTEACRDPFSNGTEGDAWMSKWCRFCAHDHDMHDAYLLKRALK